MELDELKTLRWETGKEAVQAVKNIALVQGKCARVAVKGGTFRRLVCDSTETECPWFVCLARLRSKAGPGDWHVTGGSLEHRNCVGEAKPSAQQLQNDSIVWAAVAANPSTSAKELVSLVKDQTEAVSSEHVMYRAKQAVLAQMFSEDPSTIQYLPHFLMEFQRLNPGTFTDVQRDDMNRFHRAIMVLNPDWFLPGQGLYGVDAAHMKHRGYNGVQLVLVSRDGNFSNQVAAVALVPVENYDNYAWFFGHVMQQGFPLSMCPVFSDRHQGLISAAKARDIFNVFCVRHLIGNLRADKSIRLAVTQDAYVWKANGAKTAAKFTEALEGLKKVNRRAAASLEAIPPAQWTLHPHYNSVPLYGWRTTNFVESEQAKSLRLKPRMMLPYEYFKAYATILMGECYKRASNCKEWMEKGCKVTPRAENKLQEQLKQSKNYVATFSSEHVAFVAHSKYPLKQREVAIYPARCSCKTWKQQKLPCRHILAVLKAKEDMTGVYDLFGDCYKVATFATSLGAIVLPEDSQLVRDRAIKPAACVRQAGRPRKRRIRSRGETGGKARKPYKCGRCGKPGHNKASCRATGS